MIVFFLGVETGARFGREFGVAVDCGIGIAATQFAEELQQSLFLDFVACVATDVLPVIDTSWRATSAVADAD